MIFRLRGGCVPDWIVIPGGNLGNVHALGQGFVMMKELGLVTRSTLANAIQIGNPVSVKRAIRTLQTVQRRCRAGD